MRFTRPERARWKGEDAASGGSGGRVTRARDPCRAAGRGARYFRPVVTVSELLDFIAEKAINPDSEIAVRRIPSRHPNVDVGGLGVVTVSLTDDGRLQLDVH